MARTSFGVPYSCRVVCLSLFFVSFPLLLLSPRLTAQDGSSALQGWVEDASGARIPGAAVVVSNPDTGFRRSIVTDPEGRFSAPMLPPGYYEVSAAAIGMAAQKQRGVELVVGGSLQLEFRLAPVGVTENLTIAEPPFTVDTQSSEVSHEIVASAIENLPLNGRRFTDLALLAPGVTQDPRGLTSDSNGDLSFGGIRGYQNTFLVDGGDNNNSFFAQARGRYRAPYQFSNEVIQEFRVSSNSYSAELGHSGGAVFNVVTKSGTNRWHATAFYYLHDRAFDSQSPYMPYKPDNRRQQFGGTVGGPLRKERIFFYAGFDQHLLNMPSIVQFGSGRTSVVPQGDDFDYKDQALVFAAAQQLNQLGGEYPTSMRGNAAFAKTDFILSHRQLLSLRLNTSRYTGINNVFFDASSPVTTYAQSANGTEDVSTETAAASLTSAWTNRIATHLRAQFSRDLQQSFANSDQPRIKIYNLLDGAGRSTILPRQTREHKLHVADTLVYETPRMSWKVGADYQQAWVYNYFPTMSSGEFYFSNVKVNPWTFEPMHYGDPLTPLRAYAHGVPRYYIQDFGTASSHPDSRSYAFFLQDTIRWSKHLTFNLGVRYDLQTFPVSGLISNPLYPPSGKVPTDLNNISPRVGFAYSVGDRKPLVIRGGAGRFYSQLPGMYVSQVAIDNGVGQTELYLDLMKPADAAIFPAYPNPLVTCTSGMTRCVAPASVADHLTAKVSAFAPNFQTPYTDQASLTVEREIGAKVVFTASYLYVHGEHLIRSLDANLPKPKTTEYPVYNDTGSVFLGSYMPVESFATLQTSPSVTCPYPPCINEVDRPIARLKTINSFESSASSVYNGFTLSLRRQVHRGLFFRLGYTLAKATDDGQDALVVGRPGNVQNPYSTSVKERGLSVTDQRHRFVAAAVVEPPRLSLRAKFLNGLLNQWKLSNVVTLGSGRPINATTAGDANRDGNTYNDRLPGVARNSFLGPDYYTTDLRLSRSFKISDLFRVELIAESFNVFNHVNRRVTITDDGFLNSAGQFVAFSSVVNGKVYPGQFQSNSKFLKPTNAYSPRQLQFSLRTSF